MSSSMRLTPGMVEEQDALHQRVTYNVLLQQLKVGHDYRYFCRMIEENDSWTVSQQRARIKRLNKSLDDLDEFVRVLKKNNEFNRAQIISWLKVFNNPEALDIQLDNLFDNSGKFITCYKGYITLALNFLSLSLNLLTKQDPQYLIGATGIRITDEIFNIIESLIIGAKQCHDGEVQIGSMNILSAVQRLAINLTSYIGNKLVGSISTSTVPILGAASLIAGLFLAIGIETLQIHRSRDRINSISERVKTCDMEGNCEKLNQLLVVEYANIESHKQKIKALGTTLLVMSIVVILSFTALSGMTFGAVPAATIVFAATGFVVNALRHLWIKSNNANQKLKRSKELKTLPNNSEEHQLADLDEKAERNQSHLNDDRLDQEANIVDKWNKIILGLITDGHNPEAELTFANGNTVKFLKPKSISKTFLGNAEMTFKQYIDKIFVKYPEKAQAIISALENKNYCQFQDALAMRQHPFIDNLKKTTTGCKLLRQLTIKPARDEGPAVTA